MLEEIRWILGALGSIAFVGVTVWWKVESKQDRKIDNLAESNHVAHNNLYKRIDDVEDKLTEQHVAILGKIEELWRHRADK